MSKQSIGNWICKGLERKRLHDQTVLDAMSKVPRHRFVPENVREYAYEDRALPLFCGQTISQPFIVALMTQELKLSPGAKVLEVGTGSGYQAAVLAELGVEVISLEVVEELATWAREKLTECGYTNVDVRLADGCLGCLEEAPFDAILVAAAAPEQPARLLAQLAEGGRLIFPLEKAGSEEQVLTLIQRKNKDFTSSSLGPVKFVPLTGECRT